MASVISLSSGGWIHLPRTSSGLYRFQSFTLRISLSKGHLYISGFGYFGIDFVKNCLVHIRKANPSSTLPALPERCLEEASDVQDKVRASVCVVES